MGSLAGKGQLRQGTPADSGQNRPRVSSRQGVSAHRREKPSPVAEGPVVVRAGSPSDPLFRQGSAIHRRADAAPLANPTTGALSPRRPGPYSFLSQPSDNVP